MTKKKKTTKKKSKIRVIVDDINDSNYAASYPTAKDLARDIILADSNTTGYITEELAEAARNVLLRELK